MIVKIDGSLKETEGYRAEVVARNEHDPEWNGVTVEQGCPQEEVLDIVRECLNGATLRQRTEFRSETQHDDVRFYDVIWKE